MASLTDDGPATVGCSSGGGGVAALEGLLGHMPLSLAQALAARERLGRLPARAPLSVVGGL